jgi:hypothetical protein
MKNLCAFILFAALLLVPGCAQFSAIGDQLFVKPQTPRQAVYEAEGDYLAAKTLAAKYMAQPACGAAGAPKAPFCASPSTSRLIETSEIGVEESLAAAERTVTDPNFSWTKGAALPDTIIAAENAVVAFSNIVHSTGVK